MAKKSRKACYWAGRRVELHPGLDAWMRGDRYGVVTKCGRAGSVYVKLDKSGKTVRLPEGRFEEVW